MPRANFHDQQTANNITLVRSNKNIEASQRKKRKKIAKTEETSRIL